MKPIQGIPFRNSFPSLVRPYLDHIHTKLAYTEQSLQLPHALSFSQNVIYSYMVTLEPERERKDENVKQGITTICKLLASIISHTLSVSNHANLCKTCTKMERGKKKH